VLVLDATCSKGSKEGVLGCDQRHRRLARRTITMSNIAKRKKNEARISEAAAAKAAQESGFLTIKTSLVNGTKVLGKYISEDSGAVAIGRTYLMFTLEQAKRSVTQCDVLIESEIPPEIKANLLSTQKGMMECIVKAASGMIDSAELDRRKSEIAPSILPGFGPSNPPVQNTNIQVNLGGHQTVETQTVPGDEQEPKNEGSHDQGSNR